MDLRVANVVHELRTPLTSVLAALELLRGGDLSPHESLELIEGAVAAARHLEFLTDDLLDEAALTAGKLRLQVRPLTVATLLREVEQVLTTPARLRAVLLHLEPVPDDLRVVADEHRFLQIAFNLISNALKFAPPGSVIRVATTRTPEAVRFTVQDEGDGVPPALQARLFEPFHSHHDANSGNRGTGLGLALCRALVERLDGRIGHAPVEPHGASFWFELPRARDGEPLREAAAAR